MPFVTEELWEHLGEPGQELLITADWPTTYEGLIDEGAEAEIDWVARVIGEVRAVRSEMNVPPSTEVSLWLRDAGEDTRARVEAHSALIKRLARLSEIRITEEAAPKGSVQVLIGEATGAIPLAEVIDLEQEQARLRKEAAKLQSEIDKAEKKLSNDQFLSKAPIEVVEEQKERRSEASQALAKLNQALERLAGA